jgi:hypothetical protein
LSEDYSESHSEELGDDFTFSSVSDTETQEHLSSKEERENKSE